MTLKAHASKPLTREKPPTIYPSKFVLPSTQNEWWRGKDSNLRRRKPADLQSAPVGRLGTPPGKNEPRILVTTPPGVNGIGATFAVSFAGPYRDFPDAGPRTHLYRSPAAQNRQPGPRLAISSFCEARCTPAARMRRP